MNIRLIKPPSIRHNRLPRALIVAVAALAAAVFLGACGSSSTSSSSSSTAAKVNLNMPHVERAIELSILSQRHVHAKVVCPRVVPQEQGHNFTCIATVGKKTTPFAVTQQNNRGYVTYQAK
ncbi:MAG TPA: hypothetical protein VGH60_06750 [Solirubrobacteraceae bacterium]|jgi:hypothetical protein